MRKTHHRIGISLVTIAFLTITLLTASHYLQIGNLYLSLLHNEKCRDSTFSVSQNYTIPNIIVDSPPDLEYVEGDTNNTITWFVEGAWDCRYEVQRLPDLEVLSRGNLSHQLTNITVSADGLAPGQYTFLFGIFHLWVTCAWTDEVIVTVHHKNAIEAVGIDNIVILTLLAFGSIGVGIAVIAWLRRRT